MSAPSRPVRVRVGISGWSYKGWRGDAQSLITRVNRLLAIND